MKYCVYCFGTYPLHSSLSCQEYEEEKMEEVKHFKIFKKEGMNLSMYFPFFLKNYDNVSIYIDPYQFFMLILGKI